MKKIGLALILMSFFGCATTGVVKFAGKGLPDGFVYLKDVAPSIIQEMRYAETHNFLGKPVNGYLAGTCILSREAAVALNLAQTEALQYGMSLKVYDCYRPQTAVNEFVVWAKDVNDTKMRKEFYPKVDKTNLFRDGYIAEKSGHSRGSTVDLTLVFLPPLVQEKYEDGNKLRECTLPYNQRFKDNSLDFGTGFDCFDPLSHTANPTIGKAQRMNRLMLKSLMEKNGFRNLPEEWWHFTLKKEPFADHYFDFLVH